MSPVKPVTSLAMQSIVQGATIARSKEVAKEMCCGSCDSMCSHMFEYTGRPDIA